MENNLKYFNGSFCEVRPVEFNNRINYATGKGVKVGVIDSGWDHKLKDQRIQKGIGLVDPEDELLLKISPDFSDINGHGTACTDIILRIAPDASIYPIKVFGKRIETSPNILIEGILWAIKNELKILNISLGTLLLEALEPLYKVCEIAKRQGMILVASKSNSEDISYPAIFENVIGVETGDFDDLFEYEIQPDEGIECRAKGHFNNICGLRGIRGSLMGNSLAAPVITGIIALIIEKEPYFAIEDILVKLQTLLYHKNEV